METNKYMGRQCAKGHEGLRYKSNNACVQCSKERLLDPIERDRLKACNKRRYQEIKTERTAQQKSYRATARGRAMQLLQAAKTREEKRGGTATITIEWVESKLAQGYCEVSGLPFDMSRPGIKCPFSPSIDRIDNSKGYHPENCRVILWGLNAAFSHWGESVFKGIAEAWLLRIGLECQPRVPELAANAA